VRPEHEAANRLVDLAHAGDRDGYKALLIKLADEFRPTVYESIKRMAAREYRSEVSDYRFAAWRMDWVRQKGQTNGGTESQDGRTDQAA